MAVFLAGLVGLIQGLAIGRVVGGCGLMRHLIVVDRTVVGG